jgi:transposase-like protein
MRDCQSTGDIQSKLKRLFAGTIEQMLEAEMENHLGYEKHSTEGNNTGNSRNGYNRKTIISDYGESEIAVPVTATESLSLKSSKRGRHERMKSNIKSWRCIQKE